MDRRRYLQCVTSLAAGTAAAGSGAARDAGAGQPETIAQADKLTASDAASGNRFGYSVAVSRDGSTAVVGMFNARFLSGPAPGTAYVFEQSGGSWSQQDKLTAADGDNGDAFGLSVAVSADGSTIVVGASKDDTPNADSVGSAYVFERSGGSWSQQEKLTAADGDELDNFGESVGVSADGSRAIVGAWREEDPNGMNAGAAYAFERSGGSWSQQDKLAAPVGGTRDNFGLSVAISGDGSTVIAGAPGADQQNAASAGEAHVFEWGGSAWTHQEQLIADDYDESDFFGSAVDISKDGSTAIVGAPVNEDPNGDSAGAAYVFGRTGGSWLSQQKILPDDGDSQDLFGNAVAMASDGSTAVVGADDDEDPNGSGAGSAYAFGQSGGSWSQTDKLSAEDGASEDNFGQSVGVTGDGSTVLVGAPAADTSGEDAGAAYAFDQSGGSGGLPKTNPTFQDVLEVIEAFNDGQQYNGVTVTFQDVLEVIAAFNSS